MPVGRRINWLVLAGLTAIGALVAALALSAGRSSADATPEPAMQAAAAGSTEQVFGPGTSQTLLAERIRAANTEDLILQVSAECSIVTDVKTVGTDDQSAEGEVRVWVTVDGKPVPVSTGDTSGKVTFCNHAYRRQTTFNANDQDNTIQTYDTTKAANAFNWMRIDVGSGLHMIEVKGDLTQTATNDKSHAEAVVGNRTLMIQPTHLPPGSTVDPASP